MTDLGLSLDDPKTLAALADKLGERIWRLHNLYTIVTDDGSKVPFRPNDMQVRMIEEFHYLNVTLKARQFGFCLDPAMRVLTSDMKWVPISDLRTCQEIVSVDEYPPGGTGSARKMRCGVVEAVVTVRREAYRISFDDGRSVICTAQHPWLSDHNHTAKRAGTQWRTIASTSKGNKPNGLRVGSSVRWITRPWDGACYEDGWMGGMIDGEGCLNKNSGANIAIGQVPGEALERMRSYLIRNGYHFQEYVDNRKPGATSKLGSKPVHKLEIGRSNELFRLLGQTRPSRFVNKHWWDGMELPGKRTGEGWSRITEIEPLGERDMIDLQTSRGTYIAEGFVSHNTTLYCLLALDLCLFNTNQTAGIIAHSLDDVRKIFRNKVSFPYEQLPGVVQSLAPLTSDTKMELTFGNGSSIGVSTSMRSGTLQFLLVSEMGKIAAKYPEKSREIVTGSFNTVHPGQILIVESTAEGAGGDFYDICQKAMRSTDDAKAGMARLTEMDFKFHFFPWWEHQKYRLDPIGVIVSEKMREYFAGLERDHQIHLDDWQKSWYTKKYNILVAEGKTPENMMREFPSTWQEAFSAAVEGSYYQNAMAWLKTNNRIRHVPHIPNELVNTFWDLGRNDTTAIWSHQFIAQEHRFIKCFEKAGEQLSYFVEYLHSQPGFIYGRHFLPHDADNVSLERAESRVDRLVELGIERERIVVVPRIDDINTGIELTRKWLYLAWFDQAGCDDGIRALQNYRAEYDDALQTYKRTPLHNWASNYADAFRQWAQGWSPVPRKSGKKRKPRSWKTA